MKALLTLVFACLLTTCAQAQAPYTGGAGSGYASTGIAVVPLENENASSLSPSPAQAGTELNLKVIGLRNKLEIRIWNPAGQLLYRARHWDVTGDQTFVLTAPATAGVYLVEWIADGNSQLQKLIVFAP
jgi:hypothetical protein